MRILLAIALMFSAISFCQAAPIPQDLPPPYKVVGPFKEDANRVIVFFSFDCDHCRETLPTISKWGETLPKNIKFELMPVTSSEPQYLIPSRAWYAVMATGATDASLMQFAEQAMGLVQLKGMSLDSPDMWRRTVRYAGINNFEAAWKAVPTSAVQRAIKKLFDYQVTSTPTIMIGGRYIITPDNTNGDLGLFMQLASGLVSTTISH